MELIRADKIKEYVSKLYIEKAFMHLYVSNRLLGCKHYSIEKKDFQLNIYPYENPAFWKMREGEKTVELFYNYNNSTPKWCEGYDEIERELYGIMSKIIFTEKALILNQVTVKSHLNLEGQEIISDIFKELGYRVSWDERFYTIFW